MSGIRSDLQQQAGNTGAVEMMLLTGRYTGIKSRSRMQE